MKKTLALALVFVMVVSCVSVLFASAEDVESITVEFTQDPGTSTGNGSVTLFKAEADKELEIDSGTANLRWAYALIADKDGKIVALASQLLNDAQDPENKFSPHKATVPAGGFAIVSHHGDSSQENVDLLNFIYALAQTAGLSEDGKNVGTGVNKQADVSSAGWTAALAADEKSVTLYKGASTAGGDDTSSAGPVEVKEEITVDGKLDDTGWVKADWKTVNASTGKVQGDLIGEDFQYEYALRADADNVYVAVKVNTAAHNADATKDPATQYDDFRTTGSAFRIYLEVDPATGKFDRLIDVIVVDGKPACYLDKAETTAYTAALTTTDAESVYEIQLKKADLGIGDTFKMALSYSDVCFGETGNQYDVLNNHMYTDNTDAPWAVDTHYTEYSVADLALGTYTDDQQQQPPQQQPADPAKELADKLAALVTPVEDADFTVKLSSKLESNADGKLVLTVGLTVTDIKEGVKMQGLSAVLHYDPKDLKLTTEMVEDEKDGTSSLGCVVKLPGVSWENLCVPVLDEETQEPTGDIKVQLTGMNPDHIVTAEAPIELQFTFEVLTDATVAGVYVDSENASSIYAPNDGTSTTYNYKGQGGYTVASYKAPDDSSSNNGGSTGTSSAPTKPGDAGILVFAVLGIVAIAGAVTVIKVRR